MYELRVKFRADSDVDAVGIAGEVAGRIIEDVELKLPVGSVIVTKSLCVMMCKPDEPQPNVTACTMPW